MRSFKYRIYPNKRQSKLLLEMLRCHSWVYNETLATRKSAWNLYEIDISLNETNALLPIWKRAFPFLKNCYAQSLQEVQKRVDLAYKSFFRRVRNGENPGYPRFKQSGRLRSIKFPCYEHGCHISNGRLLVSKVGSIRIKIHRELIGTPKTSSIVLSRTGKWHVVVVSEIERRVKSKNTDCIGIDLGLTTLATTSSGEKFISQRPMKTMHSKLELLSRKFKRSGFSEKCRTRLCRHYEKMKNIRMDFIHKISKSISTRYGSIFLEDLDSKNMSKHPRLGKHILDASWYELVKQLRYKAEDAGGEVVLVEARGTSQRCHKCGLITKKKLSERIHTCPCGMIEDRDVNAALNVLGLGLESLDVQNGTDKCHSHSDIDASEIPSKIP